MNFKEFLIKDFMSIDNFIISDNTYIIMTNITLSIREDIYNKMKKHSEIKWSEFVRKVIEERINELERLEESKYVSSLSEEVLTKEWDNIEDERWNEYV